MSRQIAKTPQEKQGETQQLLTKPRHFHAKTYLNSFYAYTDYQSKIPD